MLVLFFQKVGIDIDFGLRKIKIKNMKKNKVKLFGILNCTPDSFSDGGHFSDFKKAIEQVDKLFKNGADFVDVGGESTSPKAKTVSSEEEWNRVKKVLRELFEKKLEAKISLDTRNPETAEKFLKMGGKILNDVSGFQDPKMIELALQYNAQIIVNHFPGRTVQEVHEQEIDSVNKVIDDLLKTVEILKKAGLENDKIILDPGIGFGKTMYLNWELLTFASNLPDYPIMIGHSRKRFLGKDRFNILPNQEAAKRAIANGARFLRVHEPQIYL